MYDMSIAITVMASTMHYNGERTLLGACWSSAVDLLNKSDPSDNQSNQAIAKTYFVYLFVEQPGSC